MDEIGGDPGAVPSADRFLHILGRIDHLIDRVEQKIPRLGNLLGPYHLTARSLVLATLAALLLLLTPLIGGGLLRLFRRTEANFRGETIPQSYGLVIVLWSLPMLAATGFLFPGLAHICRIWMLGLAGFGLLGFLDDTWGTKQIKGLRGHFRAAFVDRKLTTGFLKAVGGVCLALIIGRRLDLEGFALTLLNGAVIALAANAINLLDLRPGRAGACFLLCAALLLAAGIHMSNFETGAPLLLVAIPTLLVWARDARARVMMGDTGSNAIGAALGMAVAQLPQIGVRVLALLLLLALHIVAERVSITRLIEGNRLLKSLDRLTGVR